MNSEQPMSTFETSLRVSLKETDTGYSFKYDQSYLNMEENAPVSLTMPLASEESVSNVLFPFFDGLIPIFQCAKTAIYLTL